MSQLSIETINPLVVDIRVQGRTVQVVFQCPLSGQQFPAKHYQQQDRSIASQALKSTKRSVMYAIQNAISQTIREVFGYNIVGRTAGNVARQTMYTATNNIQNSLSNKEKQQAIVVKISIHI